jgi:hypothetical protein
VFIRPCDNQTGECDVWSGDSSRYDWAKWWRPGLPVPDSIPDTSALESARIHCTGTIGEPGHQPCAECLAEQ